MIVARAPGALLIATRGSELHGSIQLDPLTSKFLTLSDDEIVDIEPGDPAIMVAQKEGAPGAMYVLVPGSMGWDYDDEYWVISELWVDT